MAGTILAALRRATRDAHAAIEHVPALARLLAPDLAREEYAGILARLYRFHAALEPRLAQALAGVAGAAALTDAGRAVALAADLRALGAAVPRPAPRTALPALGDAAAALGCLYVVEGSALGGRVIARHVTSTLDATPQTGGGFFGGGSAEAVRARWLAVCDLLETAGAAMPERDRRRLLASAGACFSRLGRWMADEHAAAPRRPPGVTAANGTATTTALLGG